jgi:tetratricopeptide (TPR) repeat protein
MHRLGRALPSELVELYRSWDGLRLFTDSFEIIDSAGLSVENQASLRLGESFGAPLLVDAAGRVLELDELGDRLLVGSSLDRWLTVTMAREGLLVDREGEWRDVFEREDEALRLEVRRKRLRAALKGDPSAAAWYLEAAELAFEEGDAEAAERALADAVAVDAQAGLAWELLGGLLRRAGRLDDAERSFRSAADATRDAARRGERLAEAARAAREAGRGASYARDIDEPLVEGWIADARERLAAGDVDGALNLAGLALAARPEAEGAVEVARLARARHALRPL